MGLWYNVKKAFISWFCDIRVYKGGFILFGSSYYDIKGHHQREILNILKPGDILLRRYDHYIGSVLVKGYWSHTAFYAGNDKVIHMLGEGITVDDILVFMRCDDICVLRPRADEKEKTEAIEKAWRQLELGVEYDYDFDTDGPEKFYCTEFVDYLYDYSVRNNIDSKYIIPDDFKNSDYYDLVWKKID